MFDIWGNLTEPIYDAWLHAVVYYKYTTYRKYPIDLWENVCDWMSGKSKAYILDWTIGRVRQYTNLNQSCPLEGAIYLKLNNISIEHFVIEPLMPSGRYRADLNITGPNRRNVLLLSKIFFSISDHRIEQV